jgi:N-acetylneuraminic acid mutarotase
MGAHNDNCTRENLLFFVVVASHRFRYQPALAALNGKLYAIGGVTPTGKLVGPVEEYDPATDSWRSRASMPTPRFRLAAAAVSGKILAAGGTSTEGPYTSDVLPSLYSAVLEEYDPVADTWSRRADMPTPRFELGMATGRNGRVYAVGGQACCYVWLNTVEEYDPITDTWAPETNMPSARTTPGVTLGDDGKIYAIGGRPGTGGPDTPSDANEAGTVTIADTTPPVPTSKEQCEKDGWKDFKDASGNPLFKNQGDCVSYVETQGKQK